VGVGSGTFWILGVDLKDSNTRAFMVELNSGKWFLSFYLLIRGIIEDSYADIK
jgi:hypothetical protein